MEIRNSSLKLNVKKIARAYRAHPMVLILDQQIQYFMASKFLSFVERKVHFMNGIATNLKN